jgi:signal transduction histidine kinase
MMPIKDTGQKRRKMGIRALGNVPWGTHVCQFYKTKDDLIDILVPYFKAGLENHEFCLWVTSEPLRAPEAKEALATSVSDLEEYIKSGQMEILSHNEWYLKQGTFEQQRTIKRWTDKLDKCLTDGYTGMRTAGNMTWLDKKLWGNFNDYEKEINEVIRKYRMIAICSYSLHDLGILEVIQVSNNHQYALIKHGGKWKLVKDDERKRAEKALLADKARLKSLVSESSLAEDRKKHSISVRVHEQILQTLVVSKMKLEMLSESTSSEKFFREVNDVCQLLSTTIRDLNALALEINSPVLHELGFEKGVDSLLKQIEIMHGITSKFEDDGQVKHLRADVSDVLFQSLRELFTNVLRHAHAQILKVSIHKFGSQIQIRIEDDGVGFNASEVNQRGARQRGFGHLGIATRLEELGGRLEIDSKPGHGCRVTMTAPLISDK